jgi:hypothetical protein
MATTTTTHTTDTNATKGSRVRQLLTVGAVAGVAATVVNATVYGLGRAAGVDYVAQRDASGIDRIQLQHVVSLSVISFVIGLAAAAVVVKLRRRGLRALQVLGVVLAVATTYGDFGIDGSAAAKVTLILMHLVVGAAYVVTLQRVRPVAETVAAPAAPAVATPELAPLAA